ncbi:hypothetical protein VB738_04295 [Cyanobium gracile UHCC 0139]|uniref:PAS domain-containing protein n=1 Tax=Cyanobium gracile UHCC 0139 TaxID=3110308 RepID=A0ABU5RRS3_9CYAN|nr:hypothetical protein [Cyanobium gracile]MEA5390478.1 hypothetical protein [Cyanobium gracile UHCC 0139]
MNHVAEAGEPGAGAIEGLLQRIERPAALADAQGVILAANGAFCRRSGLELATLRQRSLQELSAADVAPLLDGTVATLRSDLVGVPQTEAVIPLSLTRLPATAGPGAVWCLLELLDQRVNLADLDGLVTDRYADGAVLMHLQVLQLDLVRGRLGIAACEALIEEIAHRLEAALPAGGFFSRKGVTACWPWCRERWASTRCATWPAGCWPAWRAPPRCWST